MSWFVLYIQSINTVLCDVVINIMIVVVVVLFISLPALLPPGVPLPFVPLAVVPLVVIPLPSCRRSLSRRLSRHKPAPTSLGWSSVFQRAWDNAASPLQAGDDVTPPEQAGDDAAKNPGRGLPAKIRPRRPRYAFCSPKLVEASAAYRKTKSEIPVEGLPARRCPLPLLCRIMNFENKVVSWCPSSIIVPTTYRGGIKNGTW